MFVKIVDIFVCAWIIVVMNVALEVLLGKVFHRLLNLRQITQQVQADSVELTARVDTMLFSSRRLVVFDHLRPTRGIGSGG